MRLSAPISISKLPNSRISAPVFKAYVPKPLR
nr:MAG TPA: hypothetical protein [Caudoviricetes sp.]